MENILYEDSFVSAGGALIYYFILTPACPPRAVLQICHGMNEYSGRYRDFAEFMAECGFVVCGHDHTGHGKSTKTDDDLGSIPRRGGLDILVEDSYKMTQIVAEKFPNLPIFLLGHSMGSFISRIYMTRHADAVSGVILSGTAGPGNPTLAGRLLCRLVGLGNNGKKRTELIYNLAFGSYNKRFGINAPKFAWISSDTEVVKKYSSDKYCSSYIFTADAFYVLFSMLGRVSSRRWAKDVPDDLPVLLASGEDDPVGNYGQGVRKVYRRLKDAGVRDVTLILYPKMRHEILNEIEREKAYGDILKWIEERLKGNKK